jgi:ubiquinone/menaquinone biosynthesis C-methylase UbiE
LNGKGSKGKIAMAATEHDGHLGAVYSARRPEEVAAHYDRWAETYDADMSTAGYRHPSICLALLARHVPKGARPLLDAGAGTGLLGEWLGIAGYKHVEALDLSPGMLAVARKKNVYAGFHQLALGGPLPFSDGHFAGIVAAGVFTTGHVGPEGLDELIRICKPGGTLVLTVKTSQWDKDFARRVSALQSEKRITLVDETAPYVSMPGEAGTVPSKAIVLRVEPHT